MADKQSFSNKTNVVSKESESGTDALANEYENIILNPNFEEGDINWSGKGGCKIVIHDSINQEEKKVLPSTGKFFASATERTQSWNGPQQEISSRVQRKFLYEVTAVVRIFGYSNSVPADVRATLWIQGPDGREQYISIATAQATDKEWVQLQGKFLVNGIVSKAFIFLEGPPGGMDILVNSLVVRRAPNKPIPSPPNTENVVHGVNIITNSDLTDSLNGWFALGPCTLTVGKGSPSILPPMARDSLGPTEALNGNYILVTNRSQSWMGPAQTITGKLHLHCTYQVSAWVRVGSVANGPQNVNVALGVDSQCVNGGQVEVEDERWYEIGGSFRIEKEATRVIVYVQGPSSGTNVMLAGLQIFAVDRKARFRHLKNLTDKVRKRDIVLKMGGAGSEALTGTVVKVRQVKNCFSIGSCIMRTNVDNEEFVNFFTKNFDWAVFGNELKWYWTEAEEGKLNYRDADELVELCEKHGIQMRGHCIFWEVDGAVQSWVKSLNQSDLSIAVNNRLNSLLTRYNGKFKHYDVNNEMLHGSFYQTRLGPSIRPTMFKTTRQLDPSPTLFVNDYHIEDSTDPKSTPEKYINHILALQSQGAPIGGIGIQGHIDSPVGPIVRAALDKLGVLGLPVWFTELDVSAHNEFVRADDLEVMLREAYAHPTVEGVMLWGFWEMYVRENGHLVDGEGEVNEAGKRVIGLKKEWMSHARGVLDKDGEFRFRGFHGDYVVEVVSASKRVSQGFSVDNGSSPLVVDLNL